MVGEEGKSGFVGASVGGGSAEAPGDRGRAQSDQGMAGRGSRPIQGRGGRAHRVPSNHPGHPLMMQMGKLRPREGK